MKRNGYSQSRFCEVEQQSEYGIVVGIMQITPFKEEECVSMIYCLSIDGQVMYQWAA